MKKTVKLFFAVLAAGVLFVGCNKETAAPESRVTSGNTVKLTVSATLPEPEAGVPSSKLTLDNSTMKMEWDGGEKLMVFAGKVDGETLTQKTFILEGGTGENKGVFSGELDFGDTGLTTDDIKAVALNGSTTITSTSNVMVLSGGNLSIHLPAMQTSMVQTADNTLNGVYAAPFAIIDASNIQQDGDVFSLKGVSLKYARPVLKFRIYDSSGAHSTHVLKSLAIRRLTAGTYPFGNTVISLSNGAVTNSGSTYTHTSISLSGDYTIPTAKESALQVYLPLHRPRNNYNIEILRLTINDGTDDITIDKPIASVLGTSLDLKSGVIYSIGVNLAESKDVIEYSTNGGSTWSSELPTASFSTLAARKTASAPATYVVSGSILTDIKTAINTYGDAAGVALDLSGVNVADGIMTAVFSGTVIKSVKLPANTTTLGDECFKGCDKLASIDLTGITNLEIGESALYGCTSITGFDFSKVKSIGAHAFGEVPLTEVDMSAAPEGATVAGYAFSPSDNSWNDDIKTVKVNNNVTLSTCAFYRLRGLTYLSLDAPSAPTAFGWRTTANITSYNLSHELEVVLGPHITNATSAFWCNGNVSKVTISNGALMNPEGSYKNMFGMCKSLKEIYVESTTAAPAIADNTFRYYSGTNNNRSTGYFIDASLKKLYVPAGTESFYNEENGGFWYSVVQQQLGYTLTTYTPAP